MRRSSDLLRREHDSDEIGGAVEQVRRVAEAQRHVRDVVELQPSQAPGRVQG